MKFAYADPPYIGCGHLYPEKTEVDHVALLTRLRDDYPDGWALSASSPSIGTITTMCADLGIKYRIGSWVKPFAIFKPNVGVAYAWEPVFFSGGRRVTREQSTVRDWVSCNITLRKGLTGAKPPAVCVWILDVLNFEMGDTLDDLFPGTGIMGRVVEDRLHPSLTPIESLIHIKAHKTTELVPGCCAPVVMESIGIE